MTHEQEITGIVVLLVLIVLLWLGHNFIGNIKTAPITLVPNSTAQAQVQAATAQTALQASQQQQYNSNAYMTAAQMQANAAAIQQQQAFNNLGTGVGNLLGGLFAPDYSDPFNYNV